MGPEPIMAAIACLGIALAIGLLFFALKTRRWVVLIIFATPGVLLGLEGAQGQATVLKGFDVFMMFFAIGALVIGAPLSALYRYWTRRKKRLDTQ